MPTCDQITLQKSALLLSYGLVLVLTTFLKGAGASNCNVQYTCMQSSPLKNYMQTGTTREPTITRGVLFCAWYYGTIVCMVYTYNDWNGSYTKVGPRWVDRSLILNSLRFLPHFYLSSWIRTASNNKRCSYTKIHGNCSMNLKWDFGQLSVARL